VTERAFTIESGPLKLEGALHEGGDDLAAVVLHPHPQYGGDMGNPVVLAACGALRELGATTLRFNFRGTGRSEGTYDSGRGEADDARAACASVRDLRPAARLLLVGYSFGAAIAANVASDVRPAALALISPPVGMMALPSFDAATPVLLIAGDRDQVVNIGALRALAAPNVAVTVLPGVDHGWWPGLDELSTALRQFVQSVFKPDERTAGIPT
jgi:alpha/beta superfamily hydrolase